MLIDLFPDRFGPYWQTDGGAGTGGDTNPDSNAPDADKGTDDDGEGDGTTDAKPDTTNPKTALTDITPEQQKEINALVEKAKRDAARAAERQTREKLEHDAKVKQAEEQGNFKALYEAEQAKAKQLEADLKERERLDTARTIAAKYKLPEGLVDRLKGDTPEDMDADAKELAKQVGTREAPSTDGGRGAPGSRTSGADTNANGQPKRDDSPKDPFVVINGEKRARWPD